VTAGALAEVRMRAKQRSQLGIDALLECYGLPQARVELEGIGAVEAGQQSAHVQRNLRRGRREPDLVQVVWQPLCCARVCHTEGSGVRRLLRARLARCVRQCRQNLGRDRLHARPGGQRLAGDTARHPAHPVELRLHHRRAAHHYALGRPAAPAVLVRLEPTGLDRSEIESADLVLELVCGHAARVGDPARLVLCGRHAGQEPRLRPGENASHERRFDARKCYQASIHVREVLDLSRRETDSFPRVIREAREADPFPAPCPNDATCDGSECAAQRCATASEREELLFVVDSFGAHTATGGGERGDSHGLAPTGPELAR
jgi:hypothetical protein